MMLMVVHDDYDHDDDDDDHGDHVDDAVVVSEQLPRPRISIEQVLDPASHTKKHCKPGHRACTPPSRRTSHGA